MEEVEKRVGYSPCCRKREVGGISWVYLYDFMSILFFIS